MTSSERSGLLADLAAVVGDDHVGHESDLVDAAVVDWTGRYRGSTAALVRPASTGEVADVVAVCRRHACAIVAQGGNTSLVGGATPMAHEVVVSTARMARVGPVDDDAGQVTADAGATVGAMQVAAAQAGWRYGVDFAARDTATIGGSIATNAGGIRVLRFGHTRHQVLGVEAVLGTGEVVSRLDGLVKDNTGYDLAGLLCGSEGTLGIVTRARLALVPPAGSTVTAVVRLATVRDAVRAAGALRRAGVTVEAIELVLGDGAAFVADAMDVTLPVAATGAWLLIEAVGPPDPSEPLADSLAGLDGVEDTAVATDEARRRELWAIRELHTEAIGHLGVPLKFDVTIPAAAMSTFVDDVRLEVAAADSGADSWIFGHVADGNLHVNVTGIDTDDAAAVEAVEEAVLGRVVAVGGSVSAEHGIGRAKRPWLGRNRTPGDVAAMRRIKAALDPDGILNPGVLFS